MKYVIIGASAAGMTAAKTLSEQDPGAEIKVIEENKKRKG